MHFTSFIAGAVAAASLVGAHPGHDHTKEQAERRSYMQHAKKDLSHCAAKMKARGLEARALKRRQLAASKLLKLGAVIRRDLEEALNTSHLSTEDYTADTAMSTIFSGNNSCILSPEVTEGPYYVAGEYVRADITEEQQGVDLALDLQVIDVNTCEPVPDAFVEIWHCNSTGVYSGVSASGNGNSASDASNLDATFLRGLQQSDTDGAVQFNTLVPGHYTGRTTHIHVMVHLNATAEANGTVISTTASHVGQVFFDQSLIGQVELTSPYTANTQQLTTNAEDGILADEAATTDPFIHYVLLGETAAEGLFGWLSFGVDAASVRSVRAAASSGSVLSSVTSSSAASGTGASKKRCDAKKP